MVPFAEDHQVEKSPAFLVSVVCFLPFLLKQDWKSGKKEKTSWRKHGKRISQVGKTSLLITYTNHFPLSMCRMCSTTSLSVWISATRPLAWTCGTLSALSCGRWSTLIPTCSSSASPLRHLL